MTDPKNRLVVSDPGAGSALHTQLQAKALYFHRRTNAAGLLSFCSVTATFEQAVDNKAKDAFS